MEKTRLFVSIFAALQLLAPGRDAQAATPDDVANNALAAFPHLTPEQRLSASRYIGRFDTHSKVVSSRGADGRQTLQISDAQTGQALGSIDIGTTADGGVVIDKASAVGFDRRRRLEIPLAGKFDDAEARRILDGSIELQSFEAQKSKGKLVATLPALAMDASLDLGKVRQSTALFNRDGSGHEFGLLSRLTTPASAGTIDPAKAQAPAEIRIFVNYFGKPIADAAGNYSRSVLAARAGMHTTLADVETRLTCAPGKACDNASAASGLGLGGGTVFHAHMNVPVQPFAAGAIPDGGVATTFAFASNPNVQRPASSGTPSSPHPSSAPQQPPSKPSGGSSTASHASSPVSNTSGGANASHGSASGSQSSNSRSHDTSTYSSSSSSSSGNRPSSSSSPTPHSTSSSSGSSRPSSSSNPAPQTADTPEDPSPSNIINQQNIGDHQQITNNQTIDQSHDNTTIHNNTVNNTTVNKNTVNNTTNIRNDGGSSSGSGNGNSNGGASNNGKASDYVMPESERCPPGTEYLSGGGCGTPEEAAAREQGYEDAAYQEAKAKGTPGAMMEFLQEYPNGEHVSDAQDVLDNANPNPDLSGAEDQIDGDGTPHATGQEDSHGPVEDDPSIEGALITDTPEQTQEPAQTQEPQAAEQPDPTQEPASTGSGSSDEEKAYEAAISDGSAEALQSFLDEYPNSSHDEDVKKREASAPDSPNPNTPEPETPNPEDATDGQAGGTGY
jgi:hypothetical protein